MTLSKYDAASSVRFSFPGNFSWPLGLFFLDRCFLVNRYTLKNEKELLVINTHNSAYDDGSLRDEQLKFLKDFIQAEYKRNINDTFYFRSVLDSIIDCHPELFPFGLQHGYQMKDIYLSKKMSIIIRRIKKSSPKSDIIRIICKFQKYTQLYISPFFIHFKPAFIIKLAELFPYIIAMCCIVFFEKHSY